MSFLKVSDTERGLWGVLAYFFGAVGGVIVLLIRRDSLTRFHAVQSIIATVALFLLGLLLKVLAYLPIFGFLYAILFLVFQIGVFALWLFLMVQAWRGIRFELPVIGRWAAESSGLAQEDATGGGTYPGPGATAEPHAGPHGGGAGAAGEPHTGPPGGGTGAPGVGEDPQAPAPGDEPDSEKRGPNG
ncbi:MAG: hypothetical protein GF355_10445 [Candidatus Eisenbacteria bacterium]|nr:hypothetical protein [Candidatus Eisenbacteria bacterium]